MYFSLAAVECVGDFSYKKSQDDIAFEELYSKHWNPECVKANSSMKALITSVNHEKRFSNMRMQQVFEYYLSRCNYTIEYVEHSRVKIEKDGDWIVEDFNDIMTISYERGKRLRQIQMSPSTCLTENEKWQVRKSNFLSFVSERDDDIWINSTDNDLIESLWQMYNNLRSTFHNILRNHKINRDLDSVESVKERSQQRNRFAICQDRRWEKCCVIQDIIRELCLDSLHLTGAVVPNNLLNAFYDIWKGQAFSWAFLFDPHHGMEKYNNCSSKHFLSLINKILRRSGFVRLVQKVKKIKKIPAERNDKGKFKRVRDPSAPWVLKACFSKKELEILNVDHECVDQDDLIRKLSTSFDLSDPNEKRPSLLKKTYPDLIFIKTAHGSFSKSIVDCLAGIIDIVAGAA